SAAGSATHVAREAPGPGKSAVRRTLPRPGRISARRAEQRNPASAPVMLTWIPRLPRFEHHDDRHEPTLSAPARSQMTASSPRGTFSQAELAGETGNPSYSGVTNSAGRY